MVKSTSRLDAIETPRDISFCGHAINKNAICCIPDALAPPDFADNPLLMGALHVRFYAEGGLCMCAMGCTSAHCVSSTKTV
jgi:hypothetical protein